jgi:hypothetical protein
MPAVALARPLCAGEVALAHRQRQQRVVAQGVMVVEILIALRLCQHPLRDQLLHAVLDAGRVAMIGEALSKALQ